MAEIAYGTSNDPGLPPLNLPTYDETGSPRQRPTVVISKPPQDAAQTPAPAPVATPPVPAGDPWADYKTPPAAPPTAAAAALPTVDLWADYKEPPKAEPTTPKRQTTSGEAGFRGLADAATFGTAPAIAGLAEASGIPAAGPAPGEDTGGIDINPIRPLIGAYKMLDDWVNGHKSPEVMQAYERGRADYLANQKLTEDQHGHAYLAGQLAGALMIPMGAGGAAASGAARVGRSMVAGGLTNGIWAGGTDVGTGEFDKIPMDVAKGAGTGLALGAAGAGAVEGVGKVAGGVKKLATGYFAPVAEAERRTFGALSSDFENFGPALDKFDIAAGKRAGTPTMVIDAGGEQTRALARQARQTSPTAGQRLEEPINDRFLDQAARFGRRIRSMVGGRGTNVADDLANLQSMARKANKPAYEKAYRDGAAGVWSPRLEELTSAPAVQEAAANALARGRNRSVADGFSGYAPKIVKNADGSITLGNGNIPDMQFWDLVQRELRDQATKLKQGGSYEEAGAVSTIHKQLLAELDNAVPSFGVARGQASKFFKAGDALEAGENFVKEDVNLTHAAGILRKMSAPERELFKRGFAAELADQIEKISDKRSVLNSVFVNNGPARQKILLAMGPHDARELEALLRIETVVDEARIGLGGSMTARNIGEAAGVGTALGLVEAAKEGDFSPSTVISGALLYGSAKHGAKVIDARVADEVAKLLTSNRMDFIARGYKMVISNPVLFDALRSATAAVSRTGAHDVGPGNLAAGALTAGENVLSAGGLLKNKHDEHQNPNNTQDQQADDSLLPK